MGKGKEGGKEGRSMDGRRRKEENERGRKGQGKEDEPSPPIEISGYATVCLFHECIPSTYRTV